MKLALELGYRLFDTADNYDNETEVGEVISKTIIPRDKLFIITKISDEKQEGCLSSSIGKYFFKTSSYMKSHTAKEVVNNLVNQSLINLKTDYIDCLIMHWPYPDYFLDIWEAMCDVQAAGKARTIGVSNCRERHIEKIRNNCSILPTINQICISPLDTKTSVVEYCKNRGIQLMCYAPLCWRSHKKLTESPVVKEILEKYKINMEKMLLLWNTNKGIIPIPKSSSGSRLRENLNSFDIKFLPEEMTAISNLNMDLQYLPESLYCPGL